MTDDADAEINALKTVWPDAILLLCVWHVLNAVWRWLWQGSHQIQKDDRPHLLKAFRSLLYAKSEAEYMIKKDELVTDETCLKYPHYIGHLEDSYFERKHAWSISVRNDEKFPTHSTNTSNYIEASFRITKDGQFNRTNAFNLLDLLDILLDDSVYYKKRLLDIGNGRMGAFKNSKSRYILKKNSKIKEDHIIEAGEYTFLVRSETNQDIFYHLDMASGFCECKAGSNCGPCKHKGAVSKYKNLAEFNVLPESDVNIRALYHYIADGTVCTDSWYRDLNQPNEVLNVSKFVEDRTTALPIFDTSTGINLLDNTSGEGNSRLENEQSWEEEGTDEEDDDKDDVLTHFAEAMDMFKAKIVSAYEGKLKKGIQFFTKN